MNRKADAIIVGAGVIGSAIAFELAKRGYKTLNIDKNQLFVNVTIGVQKPKSVETEQLKKLLPVGVVSIKVVRGGLDVPDHENNDPAVIASAAIEVMLDA